MAGDVGWGIIATGGIADRFVRDTRIAGVRIAAVGSRTAARAEEFADRHRIPRAHGSWAELAADPAVDAVYVATPHPAHAEAALVALDAGKAVLVEKPFTLNAAEAERVVAAARARGTLVMEAMWTRFLPHWQEIGQLIEDGAIGDPAMLVADHTQALPRDPAHRLNDPALGGGALLDLGVYPVSAGVQLFGAPDSLAASAALGPTGVDTRVSGVLQHAGGAQTVFAAAADLPGPNTAAIVGTRGSIRLDRVWYSPTSYAVFDETGALVRERRPQVPGGMQYEALEVERLLAEGRTASTVMPPEESVVVMRALDSIRQRIGVDYPQESADR